MCLRAVLSACPASANPPTPNLRPRINHWARKTESQRWVVGGKEGGEGRGGVELEPTSSPEAIWTVGAREREKENARDQKEEEE